MAKLGPRLNEIHGRLIKGSRTASLDLFREALDPIIAHLRGDIEGITEEDAHDCAIEAIIGHINQPDTFDPAKSSLWTFLCMVARGDARDAVRKRLERSRLMDNHAYNIELWGGDPNNEYRQIEWKKDAETIMRLHGGFIVQNDGERRALDLILEGEREVSAYAEVLGLDSDSDTDVAAEVKRVKDRINLRLRKVRDEI